VPTRAAPAGAGAARSGEEVEPGACPRVGSSIITADRGDTEP
jgi:hypothetical protein